MEASDGTEPCTAGRRLSIREIVDGDSGRERGEDVANGRPVPGMFVVGGERLRVFEFHDDRDIEGRVYVPSVR